MVFPPPPPAPETPNSKIKPAPWLHSDFAGAVALTTTSLPNVRGTIVYLFACLFYLAKVWNAGFIREAPFLCSNIFHRKFVK